MESIDTRLKNMLDNNKIDHVFAGYTVLLIVFENDKMIGVTVRDGQLDYVLLDRKESSE